MSEKFKLLSSNSRQGLSQKKKTERDTDVAVDTNTETEPEADLAVLMSQLSNADRNMLAKMLGGEIKGKKDKSIEPPSESPPVMFMVECTYICELCGATHIKQYKCNKETPPIKDLSLFWCELCDERLFNSTQEDLIERLLYFAKRLYPSNIRR